MGRLIDADELLTHIEDFGEGQYRLNLIDPYYVRNAPTVDAISRKQIDEMIKQIKEDKVKYTWNKKGLEIRDVINKCLEEK